MATLVCRCTLLVFFCAVVGPVCPSQSNTIYYHAHVYHPFYNYFKETWSFPTSNRIMAHYKLTFNTTKCCPIILFRRLDKSYEKYPSRFYLKYCAAKNMQEVALYTPFYVYARADFPNSGCEISGTKTICIGNRTLTASESVHWALIAFYECKNAQNVDFEFEAHITYTTDFTYTCDTMDISYCRNRFGYNFTTFPNAFGHVSQSEANRLLALLQKVEPLLRCYQHTFFLACYALFPECRDGKRIFPCYQMCEDGYVGCKDILERAVQPLECGSLPISLDPEICVYVPVQCPILYPPQFGIVVTEGHQLLNISRYQCDEGFQLQGDTVRQCEASGKWNSTDPICLSMLPTDPPTLPHRTVIIMTTVVPIILLVIIAIFCMYYREGVKIIIFHNRFDIFGRRRDEQKKMFIAYSSLDREDVSENFVPQLQEQLRGWTVQTYQDDFIAGRTIFDCIKEGVWESQAVLVLLTENFVRSQWCLHEFIEAETRTSLDQTFKLIVIIFSDDHQSIPAELLENLPDSLKRYIRTRIYLPLWEPLFWHKLRQALSR